MKTLPTLLACFAAGVSAARAALPTVEPLLPGRWPMAPPEGNAWDVAVAGHHAYLALDSAGLAVIDIRDPGQCRRVGGHDTAGRAFGVAVSGRHAYVADGDAGLQVIDVSDPTHSVRVGGIDPPGFVGRVRELRGIVVSGHHVYVAESGSDPATVLGGGLHVIDVSHPASPVLASRCATRGAAISVAVAGHHAYVASWAGLEVIDVSNPTNAIRVGGYEGAFGLARGVAVSGRYAYTTLDNGLQIIDVSDPANCVRVGGYPLGANDATGVAVFGNCAYVAVDGEGLVILDVSVPSRCVRVGGYHPPPEAPDFTAVAVVAGRVYAANYTAGLFILPMIADFQFTVRVNASIHEMFTLEATSNLNPPISWTPLVTTNVAVMPFDHVDFGVRPARQPHRFYRVRTQRP